ncbi:hypothetical protein VZT92_016131 [Zoarces viviparus]|uniref:Peptidase A2 domain-containing protein n=1 Tax=Zoarces viviparus TaxID=48416 RepID=A0AAW1ES45_ZOAVI
MRTPGTLSRPPLNNEATQLSDQVGAPRPPEDFDGQLERLVVLGRTWIGDCWYAPLTIGGTCCSALVDTGSSATLVRPDVVKNKAVIFPTIVKLQSVTGERAPMVGEAIVTLGLGRKSVRCPVWVANLEDCILGLDVLGALDCVINTKRGTLTFPDGHVIQMWRQPPRPGCVTTHTITTLTAETTNSAATSGMSSNEPPTPPPTLPTAELHPPPTTVRPAAVSHTQVTNTTPPDDSERVLAVKETELGVLGPALSSPSPAHGPSAPSTPSPQSRRRPQRNRRPPGHLRDFVCPLGGEGLCGGRVV